MAWDSSDRGKNRVCHGRSIINGARPVYSVKKRKQFLFRREKM